jgi:DNA-directed RNA polymerase beta subunit
MPIDPETGKPIDIIFNPLGIFGRNNWGSIFELALSKIAEDIEKISAEVIVGESDINLEKASALLARIEFIDIHFISKYDKDYSKKINQYLLPGIRSAIAHENYTPIRELAIDILENGFYLFVPNFPKISYIDFHNDFLEPYADKFGVNFKKSKVR